MPRSTSSPTLTTTMGNRKTKLAVALIMAAALHASKRRKTKQESKSNPPFFDLLPQEIRDAVYDFSLVSDTIPLACGQNLRAAHIPLPHLRQISERFTHEYLLRTKALGRIVLTDTPDWNYHVKAQVPVAIPPSCFVAKKVRLNFAFTHERDEEWQREWIGKFLEKMENKALEVYVRVNFCTLVECGVDGIKERLEKGWTGWTGLRELKAYAMDGEEIWGFKKRGGVRLVWDRESGKIERVEGEEADEVDEDEEKEKKRETEKANEEVKGDEEVEDAEVDGEDSVITVADS